MKIHFKNLEPSELAREIVTDQVARVLQKFDIEENLVALTLSMENSPLQPGPDVFAVKLKVQGSECFDLVMEKRSPSLYIAAADLTEALLEALNRRTDRVRVKERRRERQLKGEWKYS